MTMNGGDVNDRVQAAVVLLVLSSTESARGDVTSRGRRVGLGGAAVPPAMTLTLVQTTFKTAASKITNAHLAIITQPRCLES